MIPTSLQLSDVAGSPSVRMQLPPVRIGDRLTLKFVLRRRHGARTEELLVDGEFKVASTSTDATGTSRQTVRIEALKKTPTWRAVKNGSWKRPLGPTHFPPTEVR